MRKGSRALRLLRDQSGVSLVLVLGIMMFLMIVGASVLTAAGANVSFPLKQKEHSQVMILEDSIHKNIMYSLQADPTSDKFLSLQLAWALYKANDPSSTFGLGDIALTPSLDNGVNLGTGRIKVASITLSFPAQNVTIKPPIPAVYGEDEKDEDGNIIAEGELIWYREPKTATMSVTMTVTVVIDVNGKQITSRATYEYSGGELSDDQWGDHLEVDSAIVYDMEFTSYGRWRLTKYENIES